MEQSEINAEPSPPDLAAQVSALTELVGVLGRQIAELRNGEGPAIDRWEGRWGPGNLAKTLEGLLSNQFLAIQEVRDQIKGFGIFPDDADGRRPRILDLHGEKYFGFLLSKSAALGAKEEYTVLYSALIYLTGANVALEEEMGDSAANAEDPEFARLCGVLHTYRGIEQLLRNRLGFIRFSLEEDSDRSLLQQVRRELFQPTTGFGSDDLDAIVKNFQEQTRKQTIKSIAAASARSDTRSSATPPSKFKRVGKSTSAGTPQKGGSEK